MVVDLEEVSAHRKFKSFQVARTMTKIMSTYDKCLLVGGIKCFWLGT